MYFFFAFDLHVVDIKKKLKLKKQHWIWASGLVAEYLKIRFATLIMFLAVLLTDIPPIQGRVASIIIDVTASWATCYILPFDTFGNYSWLALIFLCFMPHDFHCFSLCRRYQACPYQNVHEFNTKLLILQWRDERSSMKGNLQKHFFIPF